jgi:hypothetical protein
MAVAAVLVLAVAFAWGAPIRPNQLAGLDLWLSARHVNGEGNPQPSDGAAVSQWTDLSGNGNHATQGSASAQPAFAASQFPKSGMGVIRFDGGLDNPDDASFRDSMALPNFMDSPNVTAFIVGRSADAPVGGADHQNFYLDYGNNGDELFVIQAFGTSGPLLRGIVRDSGSRDTLPNPIGSGLGDTTDYFVASFEVNPTASPSESVLTQIFADQTASQLLATNSAYAATTWNGTHTAPGIGHNPLSNNGALNGDIAAIIFYDRALSDLEQQGVREYLYLTYFTPEPGTLTLLGLGGLGLWRRRRRRRRR